MKDKIYFLSDFHLGAPNKELSLIREKKIVHFLNEISKDASEIFLLGDMFDFWFEYKRVVPKGYVRLLGKLAELSDAGIILHFFVGNHDMWMRNYFQEEFNMKVYHHPHEFLLHGKKFYIGHGDGLGPGDLGYKMVKKVFRSNISRWLFALLPPNAGMGLADFFSRKSREKTNPNCRNRKISTCNILLFWWTRIAFYWRNSNTKKLTKSRNLRFTTRNECI